MAAASFAQLGTQSIGQSIGYGISKAQLGDSYNIWKKSLKRGPTYRMIGLRAAGINPILAAGGGLGASSSAINLKSNPAGMGGSGGQNPAVAQSAKNAYQAQAEKFVSEADLARTRSELEALSLPFARALALFYSTQQGIDTAKQGAINTNLPNTLTGAGIKGGYNALELFKQFFRPSDPNQGTPVVPKENRR